MSYDEMLAGSIEGAVAAANASFAKGQEAARELKLVDQFVSDRTSDLVTALLNCDPTNIDTLRVLAIGLKALRELHNHLTQAVTEGQAAALRLNELAKQGEVK